jgi:hypothetical protein
MRFLLRWILPKDEKTLHRWLVIIELFNILLSFFVLLLLVLTLVSWDSVWVFKFGVLLLVFVIGLSTLNIMQYLLAVEFNTRKKR